MLVLLVTNVKGQTTRFNIQYDFYGSGDAANSVIETKNGFLVGGGGLDSTSEQFIAFLDLDKNGNILSRKEYKKPGADLYLLEGIPDYDDSTVIYISNITYFTGQTACGLLKTNMHGDTLWHKVISDTANDMQLLSIKQMDNGDFIFTGQSVEFDSYVDVFLMRTDSLGNQIWIKHYSASGTYESGNKLFQMHNGDFLISGGTYNYSTLILKPKLIITDSLGNFKREYIYGNSTFSNKSCVAVEIDTNVIWSFAFEGLSKPGSYVYGRVALNILDSNLISQSYSYLSPSSTVWNTANDILFKNNNIYFQGSTSNLSLGTTPIWFIKFDYSANILTERYYKVYDNTDYGFNFISTSDNGFIIVGTTQPYTMTQDWRMIKTDSLGCDTLGCEIYDNVQELPITQKYTYIEVYPNPATDIVYLRIDKETGFDFLGGAIELFDNMGKLVFSKQESSNFNNRIQLNISDLSKGIYFGKVLIHGNTIGNFKVVKQ